MGKILSEFSLPGYRYRTPPPDFGRDRPGLLVCWSLLVPVGARPRQYQPAELSVSGSLPYALELAVASDLCPSTPQRNINDVKLLTY